MYHITTRSSAAVCKANTALGQRRLLLDIVERMTFPLCLIPLQSTKEKKKKKTKKRLKKKNPHGKGWPFWHLQF